MPPIGHKERGFQCESVVFLFDSRVELPGPREHKGQGVAAEERDGIEAHGLPHFSQRSVRTIEARHEQMGVHGSNQRIGWVQFESATILVLCPQPVPVVIVQHGTEGHVRVGHGLVEGECLERSLFRRGHDLPRNGPAVHRPNGLGDGDARGAWA